MDEIKLGNIEEKFADLIWENEPLSSGQLAALAEKELNWKKSTAYTILKRLCERGIFQNDHGIVTSLISKDTFYSIQSERVVDTSFGGSLPAFIAAFSRRRSLSSEEIEEMKRMIDEMRDRK